MPSPDGTGGQSPAPLNVPGALAGAAVQPGTRPNVVLANTVIVFGASGVIGVFVYTPGTAPQAGNPPVEWLSNASADPYGNVISPGVGSQASGQTVLLGGGTMQIQSAAGQIAGGFAGELGSGGGAGSVVLSSGGQSSGDRPAQVFLRSSAANGGTTLLSSNVQGVLLNSAATANMPVSSAGVTTVPQVLTMLRSAGICT